MTPAVSGIGEAVAAPPARARMPAGLAAGGTMLLLLAGAALLAPVLSPYEPTAQDFDRLLQAPSLDHPFGTDNFGRDVLTRVLAGAAIDLRIGVLGVLFPFLFGSVIGAAAGYYGGWLDTLVMRIVDVVTAVPFLVLVIAIQAQILQLLIDLRASLGLTMIFISHDLRVVRYLSDEVAVMYLGRIVEQAPTDELFARPQHPYMIALLSAVPEIGASRQAGIAVEGEPLSAVRIPPGGRFHPRCPWRVDRCLRESPEIRELGPAHLVACHVAEARAAAREAGDGTAVRRGEEA